MTATDKFIDGIEKLLKSNPLTAEREIRFFLSMLVSDETLKTSVTAVAENFSFEEEFTRAFYDGVGLPKQKNKTAALVIALFFAFDTRKIALTDFLAFLYPKAEASDAYRLFLSDIIQPFAECFVAFLNAEAPLDEVKRAPVLDKMNDDVIRAVAELNKFLQAKKLDETVKSSLLAASSGLSYCLKYNDPILTKNTFLGLCYALRFSSVKTPIVDDIAKLLKIYGVL